MALWTWGVPENGVVVPGDPTAHRGPHLALLGPSPHCEARATCRDVRLRANLLVPQCPPEWTIPEPQNMPRLLPQLRPRQGGMQDPWSRRWQSAPFPTPGRAVHAGRGREQPLRWSPVGLTHLAAWGRGGDPQWDSLGTFS